MEIGEKQVLSLPSLRDDIWNSLEPSHNLEGSYPEDQQYEGDGGTERCKEHDTITEPQN